MSDFSVIPLPMLSETQLSVPFRITSKQEQPGDLELVFHHYLNNAVSATNDTIEEPAKELSGTKMEMLISGNSDLINRMITGKNVQSAQVTIEPMDFEIKNPISSFDTFVNNMNDMKEHGISNGKGAKTLPYDANSPPDKSNAPPGFEAQSAMAGPRGKDQMDSITHDNMRSDRLTEEAISTEPRRAVSEPKTSTLNVVSRSEEWKNGTWRKPISEVIRDKVDSQRSQENLNQNGVNKSGIDFRAIRESRSPYTAHNLELAHNSKSQSDTSLSGLNGKPATLDKSVNGYSPIQSAQSGGNQSQSGQSKNFSNSSGYGLDSGNNQTKQVFQFDNRAINLPPGQSGVDVNVSSSAIQGTTISTIASPPIEAQIINIKEPVSVIGNAPTRIASEIAQSNIDNLPDNTRSILKVELSPPRLGPMEIEIHKTSDGIEIKLGVKTIFARELMAQRGDEIRIALLEQGIDVRRFEIVNLNQSRQDLTHQQSGFSFNQGTSNRGGNESDSGHNEIVSGEVMNEELMPTGETQSISTQEESVETTGHLNVLA